MIKIEAPTLQHIAESSLLEGSVTIVVDSVNGDYHYLMSEQKLWERGRIPKLNKPTISLPVESFFEKNGDDFFDKTDIEEIKSIIKENIENKLMAA